MSSIIGRTKEIKILDRVVQSSKSEFVAFYGRRRVGKTFLVREYFDYTFDFSLTGLANASTNQQLTNFSVQLQKVDVAASDAIPTNWFFAFQSLIDYLERIKGTRKKVIFLDELPWLDTPKSDFLMALEHFWNSWASARKDIILVTCGSAASWMINKLINNHGGLHNRVTERVRIEPFNLQETEEMLLVKNGIFDRYQIVELYMVTGGIPYYLDAIIPNKSAAQNIEELCFRKGGLLAREFPHLFRSLFKNAEKYEQIIIALASKNKGLTRKEISTQTGIASGGRMTNLLDELEESGFIGRYTPFSGRKRDVLYRLADFYSRFYLKFIKGNTNYQKGVWTNTLDSPSKRAWSGYAFEQVCIEHLPQIKKAIGIAGVVTQFSTWKSQNSDPGAQIDIVIDRRDRTINLCEVKFSVNSFSITKSYAENLRNKIGVFRAETKTKKSVFLTMITTYGVDRNKHSTSLVQNEVTMDALFE
ncbi:MAG: AAA+ ATPase superfamily predicted ATPase [Saprospiraceae bacterium]|jgi:AAA+ ATPase superfamily predicted ATPase